MKPDLTRAVLESNLRARASVTLAFRTLAVQSPRETFTQSSLFGERQPVAEEPCDPPCEHPAHEYQKRLDGMTDILCRDCHAILGECGFA